MAYAQQAYAKYKNTAVQTASQDQLLIMLYDGLIQKLTVSKNAIDSKQMDTASRELIKCQDIVVELRNTLKMEYEISHALAALYDYFHRRLVEANLKKSKDVIDEILPRIQELREAWVQAAIQIRAQQIAVAEG